MFFPSFDRKKKHFSSLYFSYVSLPIFIETRSFRWLFNFDCDVGWWSHCQWPWFLSPTHLQCLFPSFSSICSYFPFFFFFFLCEKNVKKNTHKLWSPLNRSNCGVYNIHVCWFMPLDSNEWNVFDLNTILLSIVSIWSLTKSESKLASKWGIPTDNSQHVIIFDFPASHLERWHF